MYKIISDYNKLRIMNLREKIRELKNSYLEKPSEEILYKLENTQSKEKKLTRIDNI